MRIGWIDDFSRIHLRQLRLAFATRAFSEMFPKFGDKVLRSTLATLLCGTALAVSFGTSAAPQAATYPTKPVKVILGYPPGSAADVAMRRVAAKLTTALGQSFYLDNRAGASGTVGAEQAARSPADGYTVFVGTVSEMAINRPLGVPMRFKPEADFEPVGMLFVTYPVLLASNTSGLSSVRDLVNRAKSEPKSISWATVNAFQQVFLSRFSQSAGVELNMVTYRGTGLAMNDVVGGQIGGMVGYPAEAAEQAKAGKLKILGISGTKRHPNLPEVPTLDELGYKDTDLRAWGAVFVPKGTPASVVTTLSKALLKVNQDPDVRQGLLTTGAEVPLLDVPQTADFIAGEIQKWDKTVRQSGVKFSN